MTDEIKDIVERLGVMERGFNRNDKLGAGVLMKDARTALTTLSEDKAALREHLQGMCDYYDNESRSLGTRHFKLHQAAKRHLKALKDNPIA